jgi:hypothetical protein
MKNIIALIILSLFLSFFVSCAPDETVVLPEKKQDVPSKKIETEKQVPVEIKKPEPDPVPQKEAVKTGWDDEDTYTVRATGATEPLAVDKAHFQILKDIVNVRVRKLSPYTDISKIKEEFKEPLQNGKIISKNQKNGELEIYYQITDTGLKKKFERK